MKAGPLTIGSVGFGGALRPDMRAAHVREEFDIFLKLGGNFVEMVPGTEQTLGELLKDAFVRDVVKRDQVLTCTTFPRRLDPFLEEVPLDFKASVRYTPDPFRLAAANLIELSPEEAEMDPLLFQLERQLQLNFDVTQQTLDVVMVNLDTLQADLRAKEDYSIENLLAQLKVLFQALQTKVEEGEILSYGIRSDNFTVNPQPGSPDDIDLTRVLAAGGKDLGFISSSVNLCESRFVLSSKKGRVSPLQVAKERGLCVISTRCFETADVNRQGILLEAPPPLEKDGQKLSQELKTAFDHACQFERSAVDLYKKVHSLQPEFNFEWASWGHSLTDHPEYLQDLLLWNRALHYRIHPYLHVALNILLADPKIAEWVMAYKVTVNKLFDAYTECCTFGQRAVIEQISAVVGPQLPLEKQALTAVLNSGVDCVVMTNFATAKTVAGAQLDSSEVARIFRECSQFGPNR